MAPEARGAAPRAQLRAYLASLMAMGRGRIAGLIALVLLSSTTEAFGILLLIPLLGLVFTDLAPADGGRMTGLLRDLLGPVPPPVQLAALLGLFVALLTLRAVVAYQRDTRLARLSNELIDGWRARLVHAVAGANWRRLQELQPSRIEFTLGSEVARLGVGSDQLLHGLIAGVQGLMMLGLAIKLAPALTGIALLLLIAGLPLLVPVVRAAYRQGALLTEKGAQRHKLFGEFLAGMKLAKIHDAERRYADDYLALTTAMRTQTLRWFAAQARSQSLFQLAGGIGAAAILLIGVTLTRTPPAQLAALMVLLARLVSPAQLLMRGGQSILTMLPAVGNLVALERQLESGRSPPRRRAATHGAAAPVALQIEAIDYSAPGRAQPVLRQASGSLGAGELGVLLGPSGSGKTTLADLAMGLLAPDAGTIAVDGAVLSDDAARAAFRARVGYVPQDPFLFDDTIRANLAWAAPDSGEEAWWAALTQAEAADFVRSLPEGLDTRAGTRGSHLSGGERQRLCLARALVRKPGLLILDEATNALDRTVEDRLLETFAHLRGTTTILMITHRLPEHFPVDRRWRIEDGRLVEET